MTIDLVLLVLLILLGLGAVAGIAVWVGSRIFATPADSDPLYGSVPWDPDDDETIVIVPPATVARHRRHGRSQ